jgi:tRNA (guanine37-N1)-methyltransferase
MRIDIISLFPAMFEGFLEQSILKRAQEKGLVQIHLHDLRNYGVPKGKRQEVDDYAYGGGAGMVLLAEPLAKVLDGLQAERSYEEVIFLTPDGHPIEQETINALSLNQNLILLCGRYKGIDQRIRDTYVTHELSLGDFVLSGGEIAAAALTDAIVRVIPGVLSDASSALSDSFQAGMLDAPAYSRPADFRGQAVPDVLMSGDHQQIEAWRYERALEKTRKRRPDLLDGDE